MVANAATQQPQGAAPTGNVGKPQNRPVVLKTGSVSGGLSLSLSQAGVPDSVSLALVRELSQSFNVDEQVSTQDRFAVLFEAPLLGSSGSEKLLAFEYINQGKSYSAFWFDDVEDTNKSGFFLSDGTSFRPTFLRTPIEIVRVTSGFGARKVPRRKLWRNHDGVDFGAPVGTPIYAAADGKVEIMRNERGFGKVIKLAHPKNVQTIYAHLSKFQDALTVGADVKQGEVIGYVGRTGWATGPHLHYEYRVDNQPIDPFSNDFPMQSQVAPERMAEFTDSVSHYQARFNLLARDNKTATLEQPNKDLVPAASAGGALNSRAQ